MEADPRSADKLLARATAPQGDPSAMPATMLLFAHPADESIALGARLRCFQSAHLVHVTDGVPHNDKDYRAHGFATFQEYREARWEELKCALDVAGVPDMSRECLETPYQEASYRLSQLTRWIVHLMQIRRFEVVFTHPYEGGHPDHDACAFAVHHAVAFLRRKRMAAPVIIEGAFYHADAHHPEMSASSFLPPPVPVSEAEYSLSPEEQERKQAVLACFATRHEALSCFPVDVERFRIAPAYEFSMPPHHGTIFYDTRSWGVSSTSFCEMAREADRALEDELEEVSL
jgi:N-acetylglucosamine malate deacetylase 2